MDPFLTLNPVMGKGFQTLATYSDGYESDKEPKVEKEDTKKNGKAKENKNKGGSNILMCFVWLSHVNYYFSLPTWSNKTHQGQHNGEWENDGAGDSANVRGLARATWGHKNMIASMEKMGSVGPQAAPFWRPP